MENIPLTLALLDLFLPLISFIVLIFFGKKLGGYVHWVSLALIGAMLCVAGSLFVNIFYHSKEPILSTTIQWFTTGSFTVDIGFLINNVAAIMLFVVALISFLVH